MSPPLTLIAELRARPDTADELGQRLQALIAPTLREDGCRGYTLHRSSDDPGLFVLYENWRSREDLDQHLATPYLVDFFAHAPQLLAEEVRMRFFTPAAPATAA